MAQEKEGATAERALEWARALASVFAGLTRAHGTYAAVSRAVGAVGKVEGKALTVRKPVTEALWVEHVQGRAGLGIVPIRDDATCLFAAIDVDKYSLDLPTAERACADLRLPLLPTRTKSGGIHFYMFGREPLPAALVRTRLEEWAVALGHAGAEVFPKQNALMDEDDVGNWINMPYFRGAATDRYGVLKGKPLMDPLAYVERARKIALTTEQLEALTIEEGEEFVKGPPCLQSLSRTGFGEGTRNNGLHAVGVYLKKRYPDDWQSHLAAYNVRFFKPPIAESELRTIAKSLARKEYNYACDRVPLKAVCNRTLCLTREWGVGRAEHDWGVTLDPGATRVLTNPPYWIFYVNGHRMTLDSKQLTRQLEFQQACMNLFGVWPQTLPTGKYREHINAMMSGAVDVEAPSDAGPVGELLWHLHAFCTQYAQAETREEILTGKPFTEGGRTYFRSSDFRRHLDAQHFRTIVGTKLYAELREVGLEHKQMWIGGENIRVWHVPAFAATTVEVPARTPPVEGGAM